MPGLAGLSPRIENERAESTTDATDAMLKAALPTSVPGTSVYRTYSAVMHGTIYGLMNFMDAVVAAGRSTLLNWQLPRTCWTARSDGDHRVRPGLQAHQ